MLQGCDVSYAQGPIDWAKLAPAIDFALVRRGYGTTIYDDRGYANAFAARKAGKPLGHWWYLSIPSADPLTLASVIVNGLRDILPGEPILLDVEEPSPTLVPLVEQVCHYLRDYYGNPPLVYLNQDFLRSYVWDSVYLAGCGLWLAFWDDKATVISDIGPWPFYAFKQYRCDGTLPGITGKVCLDYFFGVASQFRQYGALGPK